MMHRKLRATKTVSAIGVGGWPLCLRAVGAIGPPRDAHRVGGAQPPQGEAQSCLLQFPSESAASEAGPAFGSEMLGG